MPLQSLLELCGLTRYDTDGWGASERHIDAAQPRVSKDKTQKIASKPLHLRTRSKRLVRRTIGFSKTAPLHDLVMGLFSKRDALGRAFGDRLNTCATPAAIGPRSAASASPG